MSLAQARSIGHRPWIDDDTALTSADLFSAQVASASTRFASYPRGVLGPTTKPTIALPLLAPVSHERRQSRIWLERAGTPDELTLGEDEVALSNRAIRALRIDVDQPTSVDVALPAHCRVRLVAANADDLPDAASVHVEPNVFAQLGATRESPWAQLTGNGISAPVRLVRRRDLSGSHARVSMLMRTLLDVSSGSVVQIAAMPDKTADERSRSLGQRVRSRRFHGTVAELSAVQAGRLVWMFRLLDVMLEFFLRGALRAPIVTVATTNTLPGDDTDDVVRLHPTAFAVLGIAPGDQLLVKWGLETTIARALEDYVLPSVASFGAVTRARTVERTLPILGEDLPPHLVIRVSARTRRDLGIPATTIVEIRRRLRPLVLKHLNRLTIPLAGIAVAAIAIPELRGWPVAIGLIVSLVLGMADLRIPKPPQGLWP